MARRLRPFFRYYSVDCAPVHLSHQRQEFLHGCYVSCVCEWGQQIHPWPWPQLERRTGEMQEELYDTLRRKARMDRMKYIYIYMKFEDLQVC